MEAHDAFDALWKSGRMRRGEAYAWLRKRMGLSKEDCHIGKFDTEQCKRAVDICHSEDV